MLLGWRVGAMLLLSGLAGCGGGTPPPATAPPQAPPQARESTVETLAQIASGFRARLLRLETELEACHRDRCLGLQGTLLVARSGALAAHLTGRSGAVEIASDGRRLELRVEHATELEEYDALDLPPDTPSRPHLVLAPLDLADALLPQIVPSTVADAGSPIVEKRPGEVSLMLLATDSPRLVRRIVFDPATHEIRRIERFDDAGSLRLVVTYDGWDPRRGAPSGQVRLGWPQRAATLDLTIRSVEIEPSVGRAAFRLRIP